MPNCPSSLALLLLTAFLSCWAQAQDAELPPPRLEPVSDDVWVHTTWARLSDGAAFPANGLVVRSGGELTVIDTGWGEDNAAALADLLASEFEEPVVRVVATHHHVDSAGGAATWRDQGAAVLGSPLTHDLGADVDPIDGLVAGVAFTVGPVELFFPGAAHTLDTVVAWVPSVRVLFGGCAVRSTEYSGLGNTADGDLKAWPHSIEAVKDRYGNALVVVPGHGPPGDAHLLTHTIDLFKQ